MPHIRKLKMARWYTCMLWMEQIRIVFRQNFYAHANNDICILVNIIKDIALAVSIAIVDAIASTPNHLPSPGHFDPLKKRRLP